VSGSAAAAAMLQEEEEEEEDGQTDGQTRPKHNYQFKDLHVVQSVCFLKVYVNIRMLQNSAIWELKYLLCSDHGYFINTFSSTLYNKHTRYDIHSPYVGLLKTIAWAPLAVAAISSLFFLLLLWRVGLEAKMRGLCVDAF
jgi:ABC-type multidrug transport system permease subunit